MDNYPDGFNGDVGGEEWNCQGCGAELGDPAEVLREDCDGEVLACIHCPADEDTDYDV